MLAESSVEASGGPGWTGLAKVGPAVPHVGLSVVQLGLSVVQLGLEMDRLGSAVSSRTAVAVFGGLGFGSAVAPSLGCHRYRLITKALGRATDDVKLSPNGRFEDAGAKRRTDRLAGGRTDLCHHH